MQFQKLSYNGIEKMINYIVYNNDGNIIRTGTCLESDMHLQCGEDQYIMQGLADDASQKIVDGTIVDKDVDPLSRDAAKENCMEKLKEKRDILLNKTDFTQSSDAPFTADKKKQYAEYRQQLRDLPLQYINETDIKNVIFPTKPR